jgi:predicted dehydrogenase
VKLGLLGTGYWGKNHARVLKQLREAGRVSQLTICDVDESRARQYAKESGADFVTDPTRLIGKVDAVDICTPTPSHYPLAADFLANGTDVFVEKPLTLTSEEGKRLVALAKEKSRVLQVGHIFRYHAGVQAVKRLIETRELGDVRYMVSNRLSFRAPRPDMGVLHALGVHEVDLFPFLLGVDYPESVYASIGSYHSKGIEEVAQLILEFPDDVRGFSLESWLSPLAGKDRKLVVVGSRMSAEVDYLKPQEMVISESHIDVRGEGAETRFDVVNEGGHTVPIQYREPLEVELEAFLDSIKTRKRPLADGECGLRAVRMIEAAFEAATTKRAVHVR